MLISLKLELKELHFRTRHKEVRAVSAFSVLGPAMSFHML